jgi:hypothetical protein
MRLPWWALLCLGIGSFMAAWLFDHWGRPNIALPTLNSLGMLAFAIVVKRSLRRHAWFWVTMAVMAAIHVPLILFVPWTTRWVPALAIGGIDSVDLVLMLAILEVVGKFMEGSSAPEGSSIGQ